MKFPVWRGGARHEDQLDCKETVHPATGRVEWNKVARGGYAEGENHTDMSSLFPLTI